MNSIESIKFYLISLGSLEKNRRKKDRKKEENKNFLHFGLFELFESESIFPQTRTNNRVSTVPRNLRCTFTLFTGVTRK